MKGTPTTDINQKCHSLTSSFLDPPTSELRNTNTTPVMMTPVLD